MTHKYTRIMNVTDYCLKVATLFLAAGLLCGCGDGKRAGGKGAEVPEITVSIPPLAYFASAIGGDSLSVGILLDAGADPETFQPGVGAMRDMRRSGLFASTGVLPFEAALLEKADGGSGLKVIDLSEGVDLMYGTHTHDSDDGHGHQRHDGHHHDGAEGAPDPHIWSSVKNARIIAGNLYKGLAERYPDHAGYYKERYDSLDVALARLDSVASARLSSGDAFLIWHPSLSYLSRDYGLVQVAVNMENKENSSQGMRRVLEQAEKLGASTFIVPSGTNSGAVKAVADQTGLRPVEIDFMSADWRGQIDDIITTLGHGAAD